MTRSRLLFVLNAVYRRHERPLDAAGAALAALTFIAALACIVLEVVYVGFEHTPLHIMQLRAWLKVIQIVFLTNLLFNLLLRPSRFLRQRTWVRWVIDAIFLSTFFPGLDGAIYSYVILAFYSLLIICFGTLMLFSRRTNPSLILASSFIIVILIGSFALMLPKCLLQPMTYTDSLFLSTSAVCITGLSPVDIPATLTPMGLVVLSVLIQLGALGIMTFTSFFALFFSGNTSLYNQLMLRDMVYSKSINALTPTLLFILAFTFTVEIIGAAATYLSVEGCQAFATGGDRLAFACFHSLSSFCNAGFSCLPGGMANPYLMSQCQGMYLVTCVLVLVGVIGFPVWVNMRDIVAAGWRHLKARLRGVAQTWQRPRHIYDINTRMVLSLSLGIYLVSALLFFILEYNNSLAGMPLWHKVVQSVFNAFTPRCAGFVSVSPAGFLNVTLIITLLLMAIGGASQSMGGGVKVNTVGTLWATARAAILGHQNVSAYHRNIAPGSVRRAMAVMMLALGAFVLLMLLVISFEPAGASLKALTFEVTSALFTVGSSMGITSSLSEASKVTLCVAMFVGRVGIISILSGVIRHRPDTSRAYPVDNVIIN